MAKLEFDSEKYILFEYIEDGSLVLVTNEDYEKIKELIMIYGSMEECPDSETVPTVVMFYHKREDKYSVVGSIKVTFIRINQLQAKIFSLGQL